MDGSQFDTLLQGLTAARSRRGALVGLLGGAVGLFGLKESEAKHKKKHKHKKPPPPVSPPPVSPPPSPPPSPVALADATCGATGGRIIGLRQAQTFPALRSGQLTSATVFLATNDSGADIDVEIWSTDGAGASSAVLAGVAIADVPATDVSVGIRRAASPRPLVARRRSSRACATPWSSPDRIPALGWTDFFGNPCPNGNAFFSSLRNGPFRSDANLDLHFETIVTG